MAAILAAVVLGAAIWGVTAHYGIVGLHFYNDCMEVTSTHTWQAGPGDLVDGNMVRPWPGVTSYACGPRGGQRTQVYRQGDLVRMKCVDTICYPWRYR